MEKNLNAAPTEQELDNAGFRRKTHDEDGYKFTYTKIICDDVEVGVSFDHDNMYSSLFLVGGHFIKNVKPTKAAINAEFKHFGQPLPQWEKPKPKAGEVWQDENFIFWVNQATDTFLSGGIIYGENRKGHSITFYELDSLTKLADTLDDYYKGKFLKESLAVTQEAKIQGVEIAENVIEEVTAPHQYSYKGLKAEGKIPHDISGEDYESIEAFKKLLAICEALNGMFEEEGYNYSPFWDSGVGLSYTKYEHQDESPIYVTSKEAFKAFKSAPENIELFKTFLKIK